jgi:hypothetical protein
LQVNLADGVSLSNPAAAEVAGWMVRVADGVALSDPALLLLLRLLQVKVADGVALSDPAAAAAAVHVGLGVSPCCFCHTICRSRWLMAWRSLILLLLRWLAGWSGWLTVWHCLTLLLLLTHQLQVKVADGVALSDPAAAEVARWMVSAGRHTHQSILPWLWEVLSEEDLAHAPGERAAFHCCCLGVQLVGVLGIRRGTACILCPGCGKCRVKED